MTSLHVDLLQYLSQPLAVLVIILVMVFGCSIGSFLNVVIYRLPIMLQRQWQADARSFLNEESAVEYPSKPEVFNLAFPHSSCPVCSAKIKVWQNIPLLSYLLLKGRCYSCKTPISMRYPVVELVTGLLTVVLFLVYGFSEQFCALLVLTYISIALFGIDADHQLLPDDLTLPLVWLGLLANSQMFFVSLDEALWGAVSGYGILWLVFWVFKYFTGKEGMGYGDFKLLAAYGAWFGIWILPNTILLSSLIGSLVGGWMIWKKGKTAQTPMPFGPFIIIAGWLTAVFPDQFTLINYIR